MILLDKNDYEKVVTNLKEVTINNLFARSVIEHKVTGQVFVDDPIHPKTFYIVHPYGMTLLLGDSSNQKFNNSLKAHALNIDAKRKNHEWMQAFPDSWDHVLTEMFGDKLIKQEDNSGNRESGVIELNTRVNFKFNKEKYLAQPRPVLSPDIKIVKTDRAQFREMKGSVIPVYFWENEDDFFKNGIAYSLLYKDQLASTAFSSCWFDDLLELGIETEPAFRGRGYAEIVCSALISFCIENNYEPVWACRKENTGSYKLAQKLGFEVAITLPYYRLSN